MNYANDHIRNVLIAGHGGAGKTSLAEALLFTAKSTDRLGRVEDGNTVCDYDPEEAKRRASLSLAVAPVEYDGVKINLIDTPGLFDFELGLHEGIRAAESVLITVSGRSGLTVGAQKAYKLALKHGKSRMIYISKIDAEHADFYKVFEELKAEFGPSICPVVVPIEQAGGRVFVNLIESKAYSYVNGTAREVPMPKYGHREDGLIEAMREAVAETDHAGTLRLLHCAGGYGHGAALHQKAAAQRSARRWVRCGGPRRKRSGDRLRGERPAVRICIQNSSRPVCG